MMIPDRSRILLTLPLLVFATLGLVLAIALLDGNDGTLPSVHVNQPAPGLDLVEMDGHLLLARDDLARPGIKIVNFWASWCAPCRAEHPSLMALSGLGISLFGINYKDDPDHGRDFLASLGNPFERMGADPKGRNAIDWGVYGIPETFLISSDGKILYRHAGPITSRTLNSVIMPKIDSYLADNRGG